VFEGKYALHVALVHHPVNGTGWLQPRRRLREADAPIAGNVGQFSAGLIGHRLRPCNQHFEGVVYALLPQHGRRSDIGVRVEADLLRAHRRGYLRKVSVVRPKLATPVVL